MIDGLAGLKFTSWLIQPHPPLLCCWCPLAEPWEGVALYRALKSCCVDGLAMANLALVAGCWLSGFLQAVAMLITILVHRQCSWQGVKTNNNGRKGKKISPQTDCFMPASLSCSLHAGFNDVISLILFFSYYFNKLLAQGHDGYYRIQGKPTWWWKARLWLWNCVCKVNGVYSNIQCWGNVGYSLNTGSEVQHNMDVGAVISTFCCRRQK